MTRISTSGSFPAASACRRADTWSCSRRTKTLCLPNGELHTSFALGADGEFLALVDSDGTTIIDQYAPEFPPQFEDISYGRAMQASGAHKTLLADGAAAKAIVPSSGDLGLTWTQATLRRRSWPISGPTGLGYDNNPSPVNYLTLDSNTAAQRHRDGLHPRASSI